jgi:hypothetical protein
MLPRKLCSYLIYHKARPSDHPIPDRTADSHPRSIPSSTRGHGRISFALSRRRPPLSPRAADSSNPHHRLPLSRSHPPTSRRAPGRSAMTLGSSGAGSSVVGERFPPSSPPICFFSVLSSRSCAIWPRLALRSDPGAHDLMLFGGRVRYGEEFG